LDQQEYQARFEETMMPHLDAAYNLARWLTRNEHDAQDVVQDAFLRAFRFFDGFHGGNSRSWLLSIVRNTTYTWLQKNRKQELVTVPVQTLLEVEDPGSSPATLLDARLDQHAVRQAPEELPVEFREVTILRELEGLSYREIAEISEIPIGTVMSRLARARRLLQKTLSERQATTRPAREPQSKEEI